MPPTPTADAFAQQRTRVAPDFRTDVASAAEIMRFVERKGQRGQWSFASLKANPQQKAHGIVGTQYATDQMGQRYTCVFYEDGRSVSRVNLIYPRDLAHQVVVNPSGEAQGWFNASTDVSGQSVDVQWRTWTTRADRIRLRGEDAQRFAQAIRDHGAASFTLTLHEDPDLTATWNVGNLLEAMSGNEMACFE